MALLRTSGRIWNGGPRRVLRRCVALVSGAAFAFGAFDSTNAHAYVVKKTSRGQLVHWEGSTVDYTLDPSVDADVVDAASATARAMVSWSGTPFLPRTPPGPTFHPAWSSSAAALCKLKS